MKPAAVLLLFVATCYGTLMTGDELWEEVELNHYDDVNYSLQAEADDAGEVAHYEASNHLLQSPEGAESVATDGFGHTDDEDIIEQTLTGDPVAAPAVFMQPTAKVLPGRRPIPGQQPQGQGNYDRLLTQALQSHPVHRVLLPWEVEPLASVLGVRVEPPPLWQPLGPVPRVPTLLDGSA